MFKSSNDNDDDDNHEDDNDSDDKDEYEHGDNPYDDDGIPTEIEDVVDLDALRLLGEGQVTFHLLPESAREFSEDEERSDGLESIKMETSMQLILDQMTSIESINLLYY